MLALVTVVATVRMSTFCVRALVTMIATVIMTTFCVLALVTMVVMPAFWLRMVATIVITPAVSTILAMIPAGRFMGTATVAHRRMSLLVVLLAVLVVVPFIPAVPLVTVTVTDAGRMPVIARHVEQCRLVNRLAILAGTVGTRMWAGQYTAAGHKAGKAEYGSGDCCDECSHDFVLCVFTLTTNEVTGKRLTSNFGASEKYQASQVSD